MTTGDIALLVSIFSVVIAGIAFVEDINTTCVHCGRITKLKRDNLKHIIYGKCFCRANYVRVEIPSK